jgi:hypothetical protein
MPKIGQIQKNPSFGKKNSMLKTFNSLSSSIFARRKLKLVHGGRELQKIKTAEIIPFYKNLKVHYRNKSATAPTSLMKLPQSTSSHAIS